MPILTLLAGIAIAATLFASLMWSLYRGFTVENRRIKIAHFCLAALILVGMLSVSFTWVRFAVPLGALTILYSAMVLVVEKGRAFPLPLAAGIFGVLLVFGLPFSVG